MKEIVILKDLEHLSHFDDMDGFPSSRNHDIHYAIISAACKVHNRNFHISNITNNGFDLKFYDGSHIIKVPYDKYCIIGDVFYERNERERQVFLRKDKLKKLENKSKRIRRKKLKI